MPSFGTGNVTKNTNKQKSVNPSLKGPCKQAWFSHISLLNVLLSPVSGRFQKRICLFTSQKIAGGMALEAAFVVPLFLLFISSVLSILNAVHLQSTMQGALHQIGNRLAQQEYRAEMPSLDSQMKDYLANNYTGQGAEGLVFDYSASHVLEMDDLIELKISYEYQPPVGLLPGLKIPMQNCYVVHAWTGYGGEQQRGGEQAAAVYVYITKTGSVYHTNRNCSYLSPSVKSVSTGKVNGLRSQSGEQYQRCELCGQSDNSLVYITTYGNRYHQNRNCSGLKRTIYMIKLSEIGGRTPCTKC